ncbi:ABC transporter substrate-binding protein [Bradyrhizobium sp. RP6]|uniref:ABC transporter substrate-binding protein n=1 Tax=Bradyrhizobium sp. RP6 TaxID=2489596 RepID=UPI000F5292D5|nr:ABC transporter substrate-binding protein [Bradyrhizobium sp. RP6]RQH06871.1 ABC transporter substrate-binding protein [Bradyrhizobium sp. RP6]
MKTSRRGMLHLLRVSAVVCCFLAPLVTSALAVTPSCEAFPPSELTKQKFGVDVAGPVCGLVRSANNSDLVIVALGIDEAALTGIVVRQDLFKKIKKNPHALTNARAGVVHGSLSHYVLDQCAIKLAGQKLVHENFVFRHIEMVAPFQRHAIDLISGFGPEVFDFVRPKAPQMLCSGITLEEMLPQWILASRSEVTSQPNVVARRVAESLGQQSWQRKHPKEYIELIRKLYADAGTAISDEQLLWVNNGSRSVRLDDQLKPFLRDTRTHDAAVDATLTKMHDFAWQTKQVSDSLDVRALTDSSVLELIDRTPELRAIATQYDE